MAKARVFVLAWAYQFVVGSVGQSEHRILNRVPFAFQKFFLHAYVSMYVTSSMQIGTGRVDLGDLIRGRVDLGDELTRTT